MSDESDFAPNPRPTKRRRLAVSDDSEDDVPFQPPQTQAKKRGRPKKSDAQPDGDTAKAAKPKKSATVQTGGKKSTVEGNNVEKAAAKEKAAKPKKPPKPKHRIHVHEAGKGLDDQIFSQVPVDLGSSPGQFRGAIWVRPRQQQYEAADEAASPQRLLNGTVHAKDMVASSQLDSEKLSQGSIPPTQPARTGVGLRPGPQKVVRSRSRDFSSSDESEDAFEPVQKLQEQKAVPLSSPVKSEHERLRMGSQNNRTDCFDTSKFTPSRLDKDHDIDSPPKITASQETHTRTHQNSAKPRIVSSKSSSNLSENYIDDQLVDGGSQHSSKLLSSIPVDIGDTLDDADFVDLAEVPHPVLPPPNDTVDTLNDADIVSVGDAPQSLLPPTISQPAAPIPATMDIDEELADLPSDAFASSSSSPRKSPERQPNEVVWISSQADLSKQTNVAAPQQGLRQMNLFGSLAQDTSTASQANKRANWPGARKDEPPTHHKLNEDAMQTWIFPTNLGTTRDYQFNIIARSLFHNLLVALPTGLGKTFIAATVMLNWFRWTNDAQIVFVAPTKPLVSQQIEACFGIAGIPRSQTTLLTGETPPGLRKEEWDNKRVFFMTPQTIINDLKTGICDPKRIVLLVVDEAHRATGAYAYVEVVKFIRRFNQSFRVLALTATPGNSVEAVQEVIDGLDIARVEIRTEFSLDIRQYVHSRKTETAVFDNTMEMDTIMSFFSKAVQPLLNKLTQFNAYWSRDPLMLSAYGLTQARQRWMGSDAGRHASFGVKGMVNRIFAVLASLGHSVDLLKYHGMVPFYNGMLSFQNTTESSSSRGGNKYEKEILDNESFKKMMTRLQSWMDNPSFVCHPKLEYLESIVLKHFTDAGEREINAQGQGNTAPTRIMIFAQYRDSAEEIARVLRRHKPIVRPHVFVGQAASKGSEGMDQKRQSEVIKQYKEGAHNVLVATSIGEEGLDIGEIDLIICYDSSASPIRMLQRMGRTGRKRAGNILLLLMRGKEEKSFTDAKDNYEKMQLMIAEGTRFEFHEDRSPRILPWQAQPVVEKKVVEIPVENTQDMPLEPKKRARGRVPKRPKKKFHMPDNVRTGFTKASRMDGSEEDDEEDDGANKSRRRPGARGNKQPSRTAEDLDIAPIPPPHSVVLTSTQQKDFERRYLHVADSTSEVHVDAPDPNKHPQRQRSLTKTKFVGHGEATKRTVEVLRKMNEVDGRTVRKYRRIEEGGVDWGMIRRGAPELVDVGGGVRTDATVTTRPANETTIIDDDTDDQDTQEPDLPLPPPKPAARKTRTTAPLSKPRDRPVAHNNKKNANQPLANPAHNISTTGSSTRPAAATEAPPSSPLPTAPEYALPTQGIDLGSFDTSGSEDDEEEEDLTGFVVGSSEGVEYDDGDGGGSGSGGGLTSSLRRGDGDGGGKGAGRGLSSSTSLRSVEQGDPVNPLATRDFRGGSDDDDDGGFGNAGSRSGTAFTAEMQGIRDTGGWNWRV
ncbi:MAG: 3'-5' DNA helicase [Alyxoria varia]|nr:MAG: 3'-5' DNA helicase [Alyxoria varia]